VAESVNPQFHDEFVALCALYHSGEIPEEEWALLQIHMSYCDSCHERFLQYQQIAFDVIPAMAAVAASEFDHAPDESADSLDAAEKKLKSRLDSLPADQKIQSKRKLPWRIPAALIAACVVAAACMVGLHLTHSKRQPAMQAPSSTVFPQARLVQSMPATNAQQTLNQAEENAGLQQQLAASERRASKSRDALAGIEKQLEVEETAGKQNSEERAALREQLVTAQAEASSLRNRLVTAGADAPRLAAGAESLEAKVRELNAALDEKDLAISEKDRMLALDQDFLAHDRDIRDLIGARSLYIADISDATENGRTAKQFGRIFYTKDRSLVFYGFDLDSQAERKKDVSFQVWGSGSDRSTPVSLGLFYQDDTHKRWVLRCNDANTLARLDMVFVTVEPPGGSAKPTGKQLLRAYLQIQPNHP
jgi:hypothetical protein